MLYLSVMSHRSKLNLLLFHSVYMLLDADPLLPV
jgi:hypothetical protein